MSPASEKAASGAVALARMLLTKSPGYAKKKLRETVARYPNTKGATEAKSILKEDVLQGEIQSLSEDGKLLSFKSTDKKSVSVSLTKTTSISLGRRLSTTKALKTGYQVFVFKSASDEIVHLAVTQNTVQKTNDFSDMRTVTFSRYKFDFPVPKSWRVVNYIDNDDHAWCLLQETRDTNVKSTIAIWLGQEYIKRSRGRRGMRGRNPIAAAMWANLRVFTLATGKTIADKDLDLTTKAHTGYFGWKQSQSIKISLARRPSKSSTKQKTQVITMHLVDSWGLSTDERKDGPVTAGCSSTSNNMAETRKLLTSILDRNQSK